MTPKEAFNALDKTTKDEFEKRQLVINIYCWIKKIEVIPEYDFIKNKEQFDKIEALIDELGVKV